LSFRTQILQSSPRTISRSRIRDFSRTWALNITWTEVNYLSRKYLRKFEQKWYAHDTGWEPEAGCCVSLYGIEPLLMELSVINQK
jgi:hypothetical protein